MSRGGGGEGKWVVFVVGMKFEVALSFWGGGWGKS